MRCREGRLSQGKMMKEKKNKLRDSKYILGRQAI